MRRVFRALMALGLAVGLFALALATWAPLEGSVGTTVQFVHNGTEAVPVAYAATGLLASSAIMASMNSHSFTAPMFTAAGSVFAAVMFDPLQATPLQAVLMAMFLIAFVALIATALRQTRFGTRVAEMTRGGPGYAGERHRRHLTRLRTGIGRSRHRGLDIGLLRSRATTASGGSIRTVAGGSRLVRPHAASAAA